MDQTGNISIYIDEVNMHHKIHLRDDPRIDSVIFFEESLVIAAHLKQTAQSVDHRTNGERVEAFKQVKSLDELGGNQSQFAPEELLIYRVFDRVKVRVDTTTEFPLDIKCTLLFTQEDLLEYDKLQLEQEALINKQEAVNLSSGQEGGKILPAVDEIENLDADV